MVKVTISSYQFLEETFAQIHHQNSEILTVNDRFNSNQEKAPSKLERIAIILHSNGQFLTRYHDLSRSKNKNSNLMVVHNGLKE